MIEKKRGNYFKQMKRTIDKNGTNVLKLTL